MSFGQCDMCDFCQCDVTVDEKALGNMKTYLFKGNMIKIFT